MGIHPNLTILFIGFSWIFNYTQSSGVPPSHGNPRLPRVVDALPMAFEAGSHSSDDFGLLTRSKVSSPFLRESTSGDSPQVCR